MLEHKIQVDGTLRRSALVVAVDQKLSEKVVTILKQIHDDYNVLMLPSYYYVVREEYEISKEAQLLKVEGDDSRDYFVVACVSLIDKESWNFAKRWWKLCKAINQRILVVGVDHRERVMLDKFRKDWIEQQRDSISENEIYKSRRRRNGGDLLPFELLNEIFSYGNHYMLCSVGRVCKFWKQVVEEGTAWRDYYVKQLKGNEIIGFENRDYYQLCKNKLYSCTKLEEELKRDKIPYLFGDLEINSFRLSVFKTCRNLRATLIMDEIGKVASTRIQ